MFEQVSERTGASLTADLGKATAILGTPDHSGDRSPHPPEGLGHIGSGGASAVEQAVDLIEVVTFDGKAGGCTGRADDGLQGNGGEMAIWALHKGPFRLAAAGFRVEQQVSVFLLERGLEFVDQAMNALTAALGVGSNVDAIALFEVMEQFAHNGAAVGCLNKPDGIAGCLVVVADEEELIGLA